MFARRAWKSRKLLHELTSSHSLQPGAHSSIEGTDRMGYKDMVSKTIVLDRTPPAVQRNTRRELLHGPTDVRHFNRLGYTLLGNQVSGCVAPGG